MAGRRARAPAGCLELPLARPQSIAELVGEEGWPAGGLAEGSWKVGGIGGGGKFSPDKLRTFPPLFGSDLARKSFVLPGGGEWL